MSMRKLTGNVAILAAVICVAAAMLSWAADRTISADYALADGETVDGTLTVAVTPATPAAEQAAAAALPRLEVALAEHAPAFRHVAVALVAKKGKIDETA